MTHKYNFSSDARSQWRVLKGFVLGVARGEVNEYAAYLYLLILATPGAAFIAICLLQLNHVYFE